MVESNKYIKSIKKSNMDQWSKTSKNFMKYIRNFQIDFADNGQRVTHQTRIKKNYPCKYEMLVIAETLTNVTFVGRAQHARNQTRIKG